jgi:CheY-like chemotaxis protein
MKALIVDDDTQVANILREAARQFGFELVDTVPSGEDAIGKAILVDYDVITLDIRMSGVSGLDALSVIRGLRPHTIIAIISAYTDDLGEDDLHGADVVMSKPVKIDRFRMLLDLSREIAERRQAIRGLAG